MRLRYCCLNDSYAAEAVGDLAVGILNVALGLEHQSIAASQVGAESDLLQKPVQDTALLFQGHHKGHRDALIGTIEKLGGKAVTAKTNADYGVALGAALRRLPWFDVHRTGPLHRGVFGRRAGSVAGYNYSPALRQAGFVWDTATLDAWLKNPEALVPGQRMAFRSPMPRSAQTW
jgi:hypothetical protein